MKRQPTLVLNIEQIRPGDRICAAVSGGADSVALLMALHAQREGLGIGISAVHVHHGLRGIEADVDQTFVEALCHRLDVPLHVRRVSVPVRAAEAGETTEEAARILRYEIFDSLLSSGAADAVLTAHTRDDQAETVLMKLLRGAWTEGLGGISPVVSTGATLRSGIVRPLLSVSRSEIEEYLRALEQPWREDDSNTDESFTRNRIRHSVLPLLRQENPSIDQTLVNLAELAREEESRWSFELQRVLPQLLLPGRPVRGGGRSVPTSAAHPGISLEIERLRTLDAALRRRVLRAAAKEVGVRLNFDETARLLALCGFRQDPTVPSRPGTLIHLSNGLRAQRSERELRLYLHVAHR